jgi:hypothetical protein
MMDEARTHIEDTLRRIDELSQTLNKSREQSIASTARALLASVLDLHGLALAKIATGLVQTSGFQRSAAASRASCFRTMGRIGRCYAARCAVRFWMPRPILTTSPSNAP